MGWNQAKVEIHGRISNHNSDQDVKDGADFQEFVHRVRMIASEHRYAALDLDVSHYPSEDSE